MDSNMFEDIDLNGDSDSPVESKRNTKLIYTSDYAGEHQLKLKNKTELRNWLSLTDKQIKSAKDVSKAWFATHGVPSVNTNNTAFKDQTAELYQEVYKCLESPL